MSDGPLQPGQAFAGFLVLDRLHEGGMARLYRVARPGAEAERFVLKVPKLGFGNHAACYVGFEQEAMILARLSGAHVPRLVASGEAEDGSPYLVMEEIAGTSLADHARGAPLAVEAIVALALPLASALHDLHRQDVVHLDLKPSHVRLRSSGEAVLLDFGLARHGRLPDLVGEEFDHPLGSGAYISPEQVMRVRGDPRSDLFAFGVILYALATGHLPFGEPTTRRGFRRRLYEDPPPPRSLVCALPQWYQEVVLHCLEIDPAARYATAAQLAHDLAYPDQIVVTERGRRLARAGAMTRWVRRLHAIAARRTDFAVPAQHLAHAPHVVVAVDTEAEEALCDALREAVGRVAAARRDCLVTCINVFPTATAAEEDEEQHITHQMRADRLVWLRHWARPLALPGERLRVHALEGTDAAAQILAYCRDRHADHIVLGARASGGMRRLLGSVSARVASEAACTVTVVRARQDTVDAGSADG